MNKDPKNNKETAPSGITRKDAIKKMGKYAALSAISTFIILDPKKAQAQSAPPGGGSNPDSGSDLGDDNPPTPKGWGG
ncbi:MAG: hypothetical protein QMC35_11630 [Polaribacter sp.]|jgi:hypothetical protein|tara:strand:+ start:680 stop:913 length:234 start_codon:yes stop_codon:yes gene_type:complete